MSLRGRKGEAPCVVSSAGEQVLLPRALALGPDRPPEVPSQMPPRGGATVWGRAEPSPLPACLFPGLAPLALAHARSRPPAQTRAPVLRPRFLSS